MALEDLDIKGMENARVVLRDYATGYYRNIGDQFVGIDLVDSETEFPQNFDLDSARLIRDHLNLILEGAVA